MISSNRSKKSMMTCNRHSKGIMLLMLVDNQRNLSQLIQSQYFQVIALTKSTSYLDFQAILRPSQIDFNSKRSEVNPGTHLLYNWDSLVSIVELTWRHSLTMISFNSANFWDSTLGWKSCKGIRCRTLSSKSRPKRLKRKTMIHSHIWTTSCRKWVKVWRWVHNSSSSNLFQADHSLTHSDHNSINQNLLLLPLEPISPIRSSLPKAITHLKIHHLCSYHVPNIRLLIRCSHGTAQPKRNTYHLFKT